VRSIEYARHFCICCLISEVSGEIVDFEGLREVRRLPSFDGIRLYGDIGGRIERTVDLISTWGIVLLVHEDRQTLRRDADIVHRTLKAVVSSVGRT